MDTCLWVFGYGSLCWNPGFDYDQACTGYVKGFTRKFWQGNTTHRGVEGQPGRVATVIEDENGIVWGKAFRLTGEAALPYLNNRECVLGGYKTQFSTFYYSTDDVSKEITVLIYVALAGNRLWLGDAPLTDIANQIVCSKGATGHNVEYLLRLAKFMRDHIPEAEDEHLFTLETLVLSKIKENNLLLDNLMGDFIESSDPPPEPIDQPRVDHPPEIRQNSFQFVTVVPHKKLRCLNI